MKEPMDFENKAEEASVQTFKLGMLAMHNSEVDPLPALKQCIGNIIEAHREEQAILLSALARAVGLLEGLGHPDKTVTKTYEQALTRIKEEEK